MLPQLLMTRPMTFLYAALSISGVLTCRSSCVWGCCRHCTRSDSNVTLDCAVCSLDHTACFCLLDQEERWSMTPCPKNPKNCRACQPKPAEYKLPEHQLRPAAVETYQSSNVRRDANAGRLWVHAWVWRYARWHVWRNAVSALLT